MSYFFKPNFLTNPLLPRPSESADCIDDATEYSLAESSPLKPLPPEDMSSVRATPAIAAETPVAPANAAAIPKLAGFLPETDPLDMGREPLRLSDGRGDEDGVVAGVDTSDDADGDRAKNKGRTDEVSLDNVEVAVGCPNAAKDVWSSSSGLSIKILDRRKSELRVLGGGCGGIIAVMLESAVCAAGRASGK